MKNALKKWAYTGIAAATMLVSQFANAQQAPEQQTVKKDTINYAKFFSDKSYRKDVQKQYESAPRSDEQLRGAFGSNYETYKKAGFKFEHKLVVVNYTQLAAIETARLEKSLRSTKGDRMDVVIADTAANILKPGYADLDNGRYLNATNVSMVIPSTKLYQNVNSHNNEFGSTLAITDSEGPSSYYELRVKPASGKDKDELYARTSSDPKEKLHFVANSKEGPVGALNKMQDDFNEELKQQIHDLTTFGTLKKGWQNQFTDIKAELAEPAQAAPAPQGQKTKGALGTVPKALKKG